MSEKLCLCEECVGLKLELEETRLTIEGLRSSLEYLSNEKEELVQYLVNIQGKLARISPKE